MIRIVLDLPGDFYTEELGNRLKATGNFRVSVLDRRNSAVSEQLGSASADEVLLGISSLAGFSFEERIITIREIKNSFPSLKIMVFCDDGVPKDVLEGVKVLKQVKLIDGFFYTSVSIDYIIDMLESA